MALQPRFLAAGRPREASPRPVPAANAPAVAFVWQSFGSACLARCRACADGLAPRFSVHGIEIASASARDRPWREGSEGEGVRTITLFPGRMREKVGTLACAFGIVRACLAIRARHVFLCNCDAPGIFLAAIALRLLGRSVFVMQDSKFDDEQRHLPREFLKSLLYRPYHGALAAGERSRAYLHFLGVPEDRIELGYDTVSVAQVRHLASAPPAPAGLPHDARHFTVIARFIAKKNIALALDAYALYCAQVAPHRTPRALKLCGSGELEPELKHRAAALGLERVNFLGRVHEDTVARTLGSTLALLLPSVEEQHGLVVNEALAMGVPVLLSNSCGARDLLVRSGINGYVFEPDNIQGLAHFMLLLDRNRAEWERLARGTRRFLDTADAGFFAAAVERALEPFA
ncbi:MAG TPA: glycosyltransferase [Stellaceae bacterium]|nr:glycosyltransferase [Stellaceae bacterium]